jgi:Tfp pilus assembly protein PilF
MLMPALRWVCCCAGFGQYPECVKQLLKARETTPLALEPVTYLGYAYHQLARWTLAETYYTLAIQRAPNLVDVRLYLADVLEAQAKNEQSVQTLEELLEQFPEYERAAIIRSRIAVLRDPGNTEASLQLADAYVRSGEIESGHTAYARTLSLRPNTPEFWAKFGVFCAEREQFEVALTYLQRVLDVGVTDDAEVWIWLAKSYDMSGNIQAAIETYQHALQAQPERTDIRNRLLVTLERNGREAEAADVLEEGFYAGYFTNADVVWNDILRLRGESSEKAVVSLEQTGSGEFLVDVRVNASQQATFLLDPQSDYTIISEELAEELKILLSANTSVVHFYYRGQRYTPYLVNLPSVMVGELAVRNVKTLILDLSGVTPPIDGVLGENFLKHFQMEIQYDQQLCVLTKQYS